MGWHLRLRSVERRVGVAHVLRALKHPECQAGEEVSGRQQASGGPQCKPGMFYINMLTSYPVQIEWEMLFRMMCLREAKVGH